jgi:excisionase family DNA binding protein
MTKVTLDADIEDAWTVEEAAQILGVSVPTVWRRIRDKELIAIRIGGRTLIPKMEIERQRRNEPDH